jgi:hypothetical protein
VSEKSKERRQRKSARAMERDEKALAIDCPNQTCDAKAGVWCAMSIHLGPYMHELRYARSA